MFMKMNPWVHIIAGVLLVALGGLWAEYGRRMLQKKDEETKASQPKLEQPTFTEKMEDVNFSVGEEGATFTFPLSSLKGGVVIPFNFSGDVPFRFYVDNGKPYIDVTIFRDVNLPPVELRHNELVGRPPNWDMNSDSKSLEIVNENEDPVFQLYYKNPSHVVVNGVFAIPGGVFIASKSGAQAIRTQDLPTKFPLKRIFKYPAWKYPGQYE
jgi:hypothetical protein